MKAPLAPNFFGPDLPRDPTFLRLVASVPGSYVHWELISPVEKTGISDLIQPVRMSTPYERDTSTRFPFEFGICVLDRIHGFFGRYAIVSLTAMDTQGADGPVCHLFWILTSV